MFKKQSISKIFHLLKDLTLPYKIGFVQGHSHLNEVQISKIKHILDKNYESIVEEYEQRFVALIDPNGYGVSFAAARMAFYTLMEALKIKKDDEVILPGFTCSVMPNAVWRIGAIPIFADIDIETFGSKAEDIEKKITSQTRLIVAQHSFGIPCDIAKIVEIGNRYNIPVVEDCAITLDSSVNGIKVGNWGNASIFSTDHSKPLNTLIGGFLYTKDKVLYKKIKEISLQLPHLDKAHQKRLFEQFIFERKNYDPKRYPYAVFKNIVRDIIGKINKHQVVYLTEDYINRPLNNRTYPYPSKLPPFLAMLGLFELEHWNIEKKIRKDLLKGYLNIVEEIGFSKYLPAAYLNPNIEITPLRFVFSHPDSARILCKMAKYIDINWIWFRTPIICAPEGPESLGYKFGDCPISEYICANIINWPCVLPKIWHSKIIDIFKKVMCEKN